MLLKCLTTNIWQANPGQGINIVMITRLDISVWRKVLAIITTGLEFVQIISWRILFYIRALPLPYWDWFRITLYHYQEPLPTTAHKIWQPSWRSSTPITHRQTLVRRTMVGEWQEKEATTAVLPSMLLLISTITPFPVTHPSYPFSRIVWCGSIS